MKTAIRFALALLAMLLLIFSCSKSDSSRNGNDTIDCDNVSKSFTTDVNPLIQTFCNQANCHATNSTNGPGPLTTYSEIFSARVRIRQQVQAGTMPQNATLTTAQKNTIICWIDGGGANN